MAQIMDPSNGLGMGGDMGADPIIRQASLTILALMAALLLALYVWRRWPPFTHRRD